MQQPLSSGKMSGFTNQLDKHSGVTRLILLPVDACWMHVYWEVADSTWRKLRRLYGGAVLAGISIVRTWFVKDGAPHHRDVPVTIEAEQWYIVAPGQGPCHAELGILLPNARFAAIAVSNKILIQQGESCRLSPEISESVEAEAHALRATMVPERRIHPLRQDNKANTENIH